MKNTYFITATGTGIGKTFVTCLLANQLREKGKRVHAIKPIVSGGTEDSELILASLNLTISERNIAKISPWRFAAPLSPDMASAKEGREIVLDEVVKFCLSSLRAQRSNPDWIAASASPPRNDSVLLIEGVGGVLVPLNDTHTVRDWIVALDAEVILVTGSYLGAISHTLTAYEALASKNIRVKTLIISESENPAAPLSEIKNSMEKFLPPQLKIIMLPRNNHKIDLCGAVI